MAEIGFIGVGNMGSRMAANLIKHGHRLRVLDAMPDNVAYARERGLNVGAWTVNDPADMQRLMGLDAICTDRPDLLQTFK